MAFWRDFKRKADLEAAIRAIVNPQPLLVPFESDLIADLILERHYFCSREKLRPLRFRKDKVFKPYRFTGEFPGIGWHGVSWRKCLNRPTARGLLVQAFRRSIAGQVATVACQADRCERCGTRGPVEIHHYSPTFRNIVNATLDGVTTEAQEEAIQWHNWEDAEVFVLPETSPIQQAFRHWHSEASLRALCHDCHAKSGYKRMPLNWAEMEF